jgi:hypothetical protein
VRIYVKGKKGDIKYEARNGDRCDLAPVCRYKIKEILEGKKGIKLYQVINA